MQAARIKRELSDEIQALMVIRKEIHEKLKKAPPGQLNCKVRGNTFQYYMDGKYLRTSNKTLIEGVANREYLEKLQIAINEKIRKLEHLIKSFGYDFEKPEEVYANMHPARKRLVNPLILPKEEYIRQWQSEPYEQWEINDVDVRGVFITDRGERVRSKSEKIIADTLLKHGIPYKYEYPLQLKDNDRKVVIRPDFVVLSLATLEEMIIEHLGMMDDEQYYIRSMNKIDLYEKNGYLIGQKLILLHETFDNPLDTRIMDKYIIAYLTDVSK